LTFPRCCARWHRNHTPRPTRRAERQQKSREPSLGRGAHCGPSGRQGPPHLRPADAVVRRLPAVGHRFCIRPRAQSDLKDKFDRQATHETKTSPTKVGNTSTSGPNSSGARRPHHGDPTARRLRRSRPPKATRSASSRSRRSVSTRSWSKAQPFPTSARDRVTIRDRRCRGSSRRASANAGSSPRSGQWT
jgi:hypothetical protein